MKRKWKDRKKYKGVEIAYNIDDNQLIDVIKKIHHQGWEIGLHGSFSSFNDESRLRVEKELLDKIVNRQSFPQLRVPLTWSTSIGPNWAECTSLVQEKGLSNEERA